MVLKGPETTPVSEALLFPPTVRAPGHYLFQNTRVPTGRDFVPVTEDDQINDRKAGLSEGGGTPSASKPL